MKVAVVGYAGSGKSTFARRLGDALCIPVQHLDQVFYTSNWQERDKGHLQNVLLILHPRFLFLKIHARDIFPQRSMEDGTHDMRMPR